MGEKKVVEFYFDFLSPYSYLAFKAIKLEPLDAPIELKPVVLPLIVKNFQLQGPAEIPVKRRYLLKDCLRKAKNLGIDFNPPRRLPFNSLELLRLVAASEKEMAWDLCDKIFDAIWVDGVDGEDLEEIKKYLKKRQITFEGDGSHSLSRQKLKQNQKQALEKEIFGLPSFALDQEVFWGHDSLPFVRQFVADQDPLPQMNYQNFLEVHQF